MTDAAATPRRTLTLKKKPVTATVPLPLLPSAVERNFDKRAHVVLAKLAKQHPKTFRVKGRRQPLAIGIRQAILKAHPELDHGIVSRALRIYCNGIGYQQALSVEGAKRIGLDGKNAGTVTRVEADYAKMAVTRLLAKQRAKRGRKA